MFVIGQAATLVSATENISKSDHAVYKAAQEKRIATATAVLKSVQSLAPEVGAFLATPTTVNGRAFAAAIAAKDMVFVTWDDGTDSYLSHVEFNAVVANNAAAADGVLAITDLITFSGVADSSTLVAANFDLI
jgi:hypothetical protein